MYIHEQNIEIVDYELNIYVVLLHPPIFFCILKRFDFIKQISIMRLLTLKHSEGVIKDHLTLEEEGHFVLMKFT